MPCTASFLQTKDGSLCLIHRRYIESGEGGRFYHGELCEGCMWWVDSPEDKKVWEERERLGIMRGVRRKIASINLTVHTQRRLNIG